MSDQHPDLRDIGFSIHEVYRDAHVLGQHYTRPSDLVPFEKCPLGDLCDGWGCTSEKAYGDREEFCTAERCCCQAAVGSIKNLTVDENFPEKSGIE